jgi:hypothetical protein
VRFHPTTLREYFRKFIHDELGREYGENALRRGAKRWVEKGFLSEQEAERILQEDRVATVACHFGIHIMTGLATNPIIDVITFGAMTLIASLTRSVYTLVRRQQAIRRRDEAMMRIHTWPVALFALIPKAGNFSYPIVHFGGRGKAFGILIDESLGTPIVRRCQNKRIIGRIANPYYRFMGRWFNDKPLLGFAGRVFKKGQVDSQPEAPIERDFPASAGDSILCDTEPLCLFQQPRRDTAGLRHKVDGKEG